MEEISLIKIGMSVPNLPVRSNPPSMRIVLLGYLPLRYTITAPIPSATMTNAKVSVLTSMGTPFVVCDGDSRWLFGLRGHRNTDYRHVCRITFITQQGMRHLSRKASDVHKNGCDTEALGIRLTTD